MNRIEFDERARWLRLHRGPFELICNFGSSRLRVPCDRGPIRIATDPATTLTDQALDLAPMSGAVIG